MNNIKVTNNLQMLVKRAVQNDNAELLARSQNRENNGVGRLALMGAGAAGALTIPIVKTIGSIAAERAKHWMSLPGGGYMRRLSTLADRPSPQSLGRPLYYDAKGVPSWSDEDFNPTAAHGKAYDAWHKLQEQINKERRIAGRADSATLQKARAAWAEFKRLDELYGTAPEHGVPRAVPDYEVSGKDRLRIDEHLKDIDETQPSADTRPRIRIDTPNPSPNTSESLFDKLFRWGRRFSK